MRRFFFVFGIFALAFGGAEAFARSVTDPLTVSERPRSRAPNVDEFSKSPEIAPAHTGAAEVWLLGNSHTYALPGRRRGDPLLDDPGVTLIDRVAAETAAVTPAGRDARYLRLSYPNFLPVEMLIRVAHALEHGPAPRVVIVGVSYRNVAKDTAVREEIRSTLRDAVFARRMRSILVQPSVGASPALLALIDSETLRAQHQSEADGARAHADAWDEDIMEFLRLHLRLVGRNTQLRGYVRRRISYAIDSLAEQTGNTVRREPIVEADRAVNLSALHALVRILRARGTEVLAYGVPQRTDAEPIVDTSEEAATFERLRADFEEVGGHYVDMSGVVPNRYWGWEGDTVDRSHFAQEGHALLGRALVREAMRLDMWSALTTRAH